MVDAWAGVADRATGRPVDGDTLFTAFSATKGLTATVVHRLADRGLVDYDVPIATYWPEFGRHGKERITLRHALSHRAAIPQMPEGVGPDEMCDWETMCERIAALTPLWEPGTHPCYHAFTYGWIIGEVARRVTGHPFGVLVQEEICAPLGISSLYLGLPDRLDTLRHDMGALPQSRCSYNSEAEEWSSRERMPARNQPLLRL